MQALTGISKLKAGKNHFGYFKAVYGEIAWNINRFNILFASANLVMCERAGRTKNLNICNTMS